MQSLLPKSTSIKDTTKWVKRAQEVYAFITPFWLHHNLVMPIGMHNVPVTIQRVINYTLQGITRVSVNLDDMLILSDS